jgi:hypothetical protein
MCDDEVMRSPWHRRPVRRGTVATRLLLIGAILCAAVVVTACGGSAPFHAHPFEPLEINNTPTSLSVSDLAGEQIPQTKNCSFGHPTSGNDPGAVSEVVILCAGSGTNLTGYIETLTNAVSAPNVTCLKNQGFVLCNLRKGTVLVHVQATDEDGALSLLEYTTAYLFNSHVGSG